jgi:putative aminopeptidase FrvX
MVRSINGDGTLNVTKIGGPIIATLDSEYCKILTRDNKVYTGTIVCNSASTHVYADANKQRQEENIIVRIDEKVNSAKDTKELGIQNGDYVFIEPKFTITDSGFIKSRFIDDKASVCLILTILKYFKDTNTKPKYDTLVYFVNHEEVGHGAATVDPKITEFVTVDMGCVGKDLAGNEYSVSIAAKDSGGPYDYELTTRLINLAKENEVNYVVDIFPYYGSDVGAAYRAGVDVKGALIGQGVHASHGMERTHLDGVINTMKLLYLYLTK